MQTSVTPWKQERNNNMVCLIVLCCLGLSCHSCISSPHQRFCTPLHHQWFVCSCQGGSALTRIVETWVSCQLFEVNLSHITIPPYFCPFQSSICTCLTRVCVATFAETGCSMCTRGDVLRCSRCKVTRYKVTLKKMPAMSTMTTLLLKVLFGNMSAKRLADPQGRMQRSVFT
jgi:hypothetical protein